MLKATSLVLFAISWASVSAGGLDLPPYMPKCSLSDPNLSKCFLEAANKAIPILVKEPIYPFPNHPSRSTKLPLFPLNLPEALVIGNGIKYTLQDVDVEAWSNIVLTDAVVDFEKGKFSFVGTLDKVQAIAENYSITDGQILNMSVYGHGKHNFTIVGITISVQAIIGVYKVGDDEYMHYFNSDVDTKIEDGYFYFENILTVENKDVNLIIRKNWKKFYDQIKVAVDSYADLFINSRIWKITNAVPMNKMFLP